jgi:YidC/Oxa1 family membrane protein insertase
MDRTQIAIIAIAALMFLISMQLGAGATSRPPASSGSSTPAAVRPSDGEQVEAGIEPGSAERGPALEPAAVQRELVRSELANPVLRLAVTNEGGRLDSVELIEFADRKGKPAGPVQLVTVPEQGELAGSYGPDLAFASRRDLRWEVVGSSARSVTHRLESNGVEVSRTLELDPEGYGGRLQLAISNRGSAPVKARLDLGLFGRERPVQAPDHLPGYQLVASVAGSLERLIVHDLEVGGMFSGPSKTTKDFPFAVDWVGVESQYFLLAVLADQPRDYGAHWESRGEHYGEIGIRFPAGQTDLALPPGQKIEKEYRLYLGPKLESDALSVDARLEPALRVGWQWVRPLVVLFAESLHWIHEHVLANYGVAIILLTVLLRLVTYPLTQYSMKSMKRMSALAPQMREIQEKFANDSARMQQEVMALYRRTGTNPVAAMGGGCLPMLLQMPFMVALYFALQGSIELRHAPFMLWIDDLSAPEDLFSVAGVPIRLLPLLMGASMILQQYLTPSTGDAQQAQQRQMMMLMSVMFVFMFYQFPAGLVLYWLVSNVLGIGQQLLVNREPTAPVRGVVAS